MAVLMRFASALAMGLAIVGPVAAKESAQDAALETRIGEEGFESPPATLAQVDWLVGQWAGDGIGGAPAMESWLPPMGGTMVGTFVQETADGTIMFTEHMYLAEENGTLALKLKHFNADLTGWEEKDDMLTFRLVANEPCAAYFNALTLRCADPDRPGEGLVAAVRMQEGGELVFRFEGVAMDKTSPSSCPNAITTIEMNECFAKRLEASDQRRSTYFAKALELNAGREQLLNEMRASEAAFDTYREAECGAVLTDWLEGGGSARTIFVLGCHIELSDQRTKAIWGGWLLPFADSTPLFLPEPKPTR